MSYVVVLVAGEQNASFSYTAWPGVFWAFFRARGVWWVGQGSLSQEADAGRPGVLVGGGRGKGGKGVGGAK